MLRTGNPALKPDSFTSLVEGKAGNGSLTGGGEALAAWSGAPEVVEIERGGRGGRGSFR